MSGASPLGRYALDDGSGAALVEVRLLGTPLPLLVAGREHHDALMREFRLLALAGQPQDSAPSRLVELTRVLGTRYGAAASRRDEEVDEALERGETTMDLVYEVPPDVVDAARALDRLMGEADEHCRAADLLTLERSPLLKQFAGWYLGQFVDQVAGLPARPWTGPLHPEA